MAPSPGLASGFSDRLTGQDNAGLAQAFAEAGYTLNAGAATLRPFVSLAYMRLRADAAQETGGAAALASSAQTTEAGVTTLGVRPSIPLSLGPVQARLEGMVGWRHALGALAPSANEAFANGADFTVRGAPLARDAAALEAGLSLGLGQSGRLGVNYGGQFSTRTADQVVRLDLRVQF